MQKLNYILFPLIIIAFFSVNADAAQTMQTRDLNFSNQFNIYDVDNMTVNKVNDIIYIEPGTAQEIQSKLDLCANKQFCKVEFMEGLSIINESLLIYDNTTIYGAGIGKTILRAHTNMQGDNIIENYNRQFGKSNHNIEISHMTIESLEDKQNRAIYFQNQNANANFNLMSYNIHHLEAYSVNNTIIAVANSRNVIVSDNHIHGDPDNVYPIDPNALTISNCDHVIASNNIIHHIPNDAISIQKSNKVLATDNIVYNCGLGGIFMYTTTPKEGEYNIISDNIIFDSENGVTIEGDFGSDLIISNNNIYNMSDEGMHFSFGQANCRDCFNRISITNNNVKNAYSEGLRLIIGATNTTGYNWNINGNNIFNNRSDNSNYRGIYIQDAYYAKVNDNNVYQEKGFGIVLQSSFYSTINDNTIANGTQNGILVDESKYNIINDNIIVGFYNNKTDPSSSTSGRGIYIAADSGRPDSKYNSIKNNKIVYCYNGIVEKDSGQQYNEYLYTDFHDIINQETDIKTNTGSWIYRGTGLISGISNAYNYIISQFDLSGDLTVSGNISGDQNWTDNQNYPPACSSNKFLTALGDSTTCTQPVADDIASGTFSGSSYNFTTEVNSPKINNEVYIKAGNTTGLIEALGSVNPIVMEYGIYKTNETINFTRQSTYIKGEIQFRNRYSLANAIVIQADVGLAGKDIIDVRPSARGSKIENIILDGNGIARDGIALNAGSFTANYLVLTNMTRNGLLAENSIDAGNVLEHVTSYNNDLHGLVIERNDFRIYDYYGYRNFNGAGIMLSDGGGIQLDMSHTFSNKYGIYMNGTDAATIYGNVFETNTDAAIYIDSTYNTVNRATFVGNTMYGNDADTTNKPHIFLDADSTNNIQFITFEGNTFDASADVFNYTGAEEDFVLNTFGESNVYDAGIGVFPNNMAVVSSSETNGQFTYLNTDLQIDNTDSGAQSFILRRLSSDSQRSKMYIDDKDLVFVSEQDETSGDFGGFNFILEQQDSLFKVSGGSSTNDNFFVDYNGTIISERSEDGYALNLRTLNNQNISMRIGAEDYDYGFHWEYEGAGTGNNNILRFYAENQTQVDENVYTVYQNGTFEFNKLAGSYTGGSAYVCVNNNGEIFASESACP